MDALAVERYRYLLVVLAGGLLVGVIAARLLARRPRAPELAADLSPAPATRRQVLPHIMLLLVALATGTGVLLLVPAMIAMRYVPGRTVSALVVAALLLMGAPLVYAWRSRPF